MEALSTYIAAQAKLGANIDRLAEIARVRSALDAEQAVLVVDSGVQVNRMGANPFNDRILRSELAAALRMSPRGADILIDRSHALVNDLPATLAALQGGDISWQHASAVIDQSASVPDEAKAAFEERVLPVARTASPSRVRERAKRIRELLHPETITERRSKAIDDRRVWLTPAEDGMAELGALLPVEAATAIYNRVTEIARGLRCAEEERHTAQLRADVFSDLLVNGEVSAALGIGAGIVAKVWVTVPVLTLLGRADLPGKLDGVVPVAPEVARALAAHAPSFTRILTHPETGAVLSMGQAVYKPPKDLQNYIRMRDGTCRTPWNCSCRARFTDIDHTIPYSRGGDTDAENLACLCPGDHRLKHGSAWRVTQAGTGVLEWTSPSLHAYITRPQAEPVD